MVREINKRKYFRSFLITALIFLIAIFIIWQINNYLRDDVVGGNDNLRAQILGLNLRSRLLEGDCSVPVYSLIKNNVDLGRSVSELEDRMGKNHKDVLEQKELYQISEITTWLLLKDREESCSENFNLILFFYTNEKKDNLDRISEDQGYVLDSLFNRNKDVIIFSFDVNTQNPAVEALVEIYDIEKVPSVVVNEKKYEGFKSLKELESVIEK